MSLPLLLADVPDLPQRSRRERVEAVEGVSGPERTEVDLLRIAPGANRIYVQAVLPDGELGLFLVDTGANVSVLTEDTATRLALPAGETQGLWGLGGTQSARLTSLPSLGLGEDVVFDVEVLVGVRGLSDTAGFMPVDGLLGNNVWSRFTVEIDYPADRLVLHRPGEGFPDSARAVPMHYDGHVHTLVSVKTAGKAAQVVAEVDTGASELTLCAASGVPLAGEHTEGLEMLLGIGASQTLPPYRFLNMTRRIPVEEVELGGAVVDVDLPIRWLSYEDTASAGCGDDLVGAMKGLVGHEYLSHHRVFFDYAGGRFALLPSRRPARQLDGHAVILDQEVAAHGEGPGRALVRGKLLVGMGKIDDALAAFRAFEAWPEARPSERAEASIWIARVLRSEGRHDEAWAALAGLSAGDLVDQDQIVGTVNGLVFEGRPDEARTIATAAVAERPEEGFAHVALADALLHQGDLDGAQAEMLEAVRLAGFPDAHLLRRARIALASGDRYGSMAHVRKQIQLYPHDGATLWFYATLASEPRDRETFRADLDAAMARLHPYDRPFDFLVAAHRILGDDDEVGRFLAEGLSHHCEDMPSELPERGNCYAWYEALAGTDLDDALARIDASLAETGPRADFLDTKAMVHLARGEHAAAAAAAHEAARLSPDDVYMLWQAERIGQIAGRKPPGVASPPVSEYNDGSP